MASRADNAQGRFGGEPGASGNVEDAHPWRDVSRAQQEGYEMSRDGREGSVISGRGFILVGQFFWHSSAPFDRQPNIEHDNAKG